VERVGTALADSLLREQIDFDYLDEDALSAATVREGVLQVGEESFSCLLLPPTTAISQAAFEKIQTFVAEGGRLVCVGVTERHSDRLRIANCELRIGRTLDSEIRNPKSEMCGVRSLPTLLYDAPDRALRITHHVSRITHHPA
jgi:hypothetical protein